MNDFEKMSLQEKWGWLCEDIENPEVRRNTMLVLENSSRFMVENDLTSNEALEELLLEVEGDNPNVSGYTGANGAIGATGRTGVTNYVVPKVMFPVIRRVMPQLIANELVSVQPINGRTGVVFYASYQFSNDKGGVKAGDQFTGHYVIDEEGDYTDIRAGGSKAIRAQAYYSSQKCGPFQGYVEFTVTRGGSSPEWTYTAAATDAKLITIDTGLNNFFKDTPTPELLSLEFYPVLGGPVKEMVKATEASTTEYKYDTGTVTYKVATDVSYDHVDLEKAYEGILKAYEEGRISKERIEISVRKILSKKVAQKILVLA